MPNWCENVLRLTSSDPKVLKSAIGAWKQDKLLQFFKPEPDYSKCSEAERRAVFTLTQNRFGDAPMPDWWYWRNANWGTKWDIEHCGRLKRLGENTVELRFVTAWSPPLGAYDSAASSMGFEITAYYSDLSMDFCGRYKSSGEVEDYNCSGKIPNDIDDALGISEQIRQLSDDEQCDAA